MTIIIFSSLAQFLKVWGISGLSSKVYWTQAQHCSWLIVLLKKSRSHYKELQHWLMMQCHAATQSHCQCHHSITLPMSPLDCSNANSSLMPAASGWCPCDCPFSNFWTCCKKATTGHCHLATTGQCHFALMQPSLLHMMVPRQPKASN